jgi:hypothetical protein
MSDPAYATVQINSLARRLNDLMANTGQPDTEAIADACVELRVFANQIRMWAYDKEVNKAA